MAKGECDMKRFIFLLISIIIFVALAAAFWVGRVKMGEVYEDVTRPELPEAVSVTSIFVQPEPPVVTLSTGDTKVAPVASSSSPYPEQFNLAIPFTPQAPHGNW